MVSICLCVLYHHADCLKVLCWERWFTVRCRISQCHQNPKSSSKWWTVNANCHFEALRYHVDLRHAQRLCRIVESDRSILFSTFRHVAKDCSRQHQPPRYSWWNAEEAPQPSSSLRNRFSSRLGTSPAQVDCVGTETMASSRYSLPARRWIRCSHA